MCFVLFLFVVFGFHCILFLILDFLVFENWNLSFLILHVPEDFQ